MVLTATQRPPGRDQSRSQKIRRTQQLSHTQLSAVRQHDGQSLHEPRPRSFSRQSNQYSGLCHSSEARTLIVHRQTLLTLSSGAINQLFHLPSVIKVEEFVLMTEGKGAHRNSRIDISRYDCTWLEDLKDSTTSITLYSILTHCCV